MGVILAFRDLSPQASRFDGKSGGKNFSASRARFTHITRYRSRLPWRAGMTRSKETISGNASVDMFSTGS